MTRRETRWLGAGLLLGIAAASALFLVWDRVPVAEPSDDHAQHEVQSPPASQEVTDPAVQLSAEEQRQVGLETTSVQRQTITEEITAIGRVAEPETAIRTISARVGGRIDRLLVNFTGQPVRIGQPVAEIYSPEIVTAAEEYKLSIENRKHLAASRQADAISQADALVEASRRRLELWGLTSEQVETLLASPELPLHITIASSAAGIIRTRNVTEGQYVEAGDALFDVIDLSTVWVEAEVFQADIGRIRPGMRGEIASDALPGVTLRGTVSFITPQSNSETRTTPVRIQVENPGMRLRPGMFVRSVFQIPLGSNVLTVPRSAVIDTGADRIVYIALPNGIFQRRSIQTGAPGKDYYTVVSGLSDGETVVTNGAFLVDSQTRLTGGLTGLFGGSTSFNERAPSPAAAYRFDVRIEPDHSVRASLVDSSGNAVTDAQVRVTNVMPAMPSMGMPEMRSATDLRWNGSEYLGTVTPAMAGSWNVVVEARRGNEVLATYRTRFDSR